MKTIFKEEDGNFVMYFDGRLDTAASVNVAKELQPLKDCKDHNIILDCTRLEYISSSGLRLFLGVLKDAKAVGSKVYIRGLNSDVQSVFAMTGFSNLFEYC